MRGGLSSLAIKGACVGLQFAVGVILARSLGPDGYGSYAFALALIVLLAIAAQMGFPGLLVRMTAVYHAQNEYSLLKGLLARATQFVLLSSMLLASIAAFLLSSVDLVSADATKDSLLAGLVLLPCLALLATNTSMLRGLGHVVVGQIPDQIFRPGLLLAVLLLMNWYGPLNPELAMMANVLATAAALFIGSQMLRIHKPTSLKLAHTEYRSVEWARTALPFLLLAGGQVVNHQTDILMLGILSTQEQVGLYRVSVQIADALGMALMALTAVITPQLARLHAEEDWIAIKVILVSSHRAGFVMLLPLSLALVIGAAPILAFLFGSEYAAAGNALAILVLGKTLYATLGFCGVALSMFGQASLATAVTAVTVAMNIGLNLVFIPLMGMEGAALATVFSVISVNTALAVWMYRRYGLNLTAMGKRS